MTYEALKLFLLGAISRAFQPGCKFEIMLCLVGGQGAGKSTFFRLLAVRDEWFSDDLRKLDDDNVYRKLQGHWIIEMSEMMATANAKSIEEIKSFLSRQKEVYKIPYETHPADRPRQCVFGGTSNALDFLPLDRSGNRRFIPVMVYPEQAEVHILEDEAASRAYIEQMWAEAMEIYRSGRFKLAFSPAMQRYLKEHQRDFMPEDTKAGMIQAYLDKYTGSMVCSKQLYKEALNHAFDEPKQWEIREINRTMKIDVLSTIVDKIKKGNNVHQHLDLIAGLPYEGYESFGKSFDRVYKMNPEQLQLGFLKVLKGSVMHDRAQEYGIVYQDRAPYEVLSTKWLTYAEVIRLKQIEEMVEVYYNSGQFCCTMAALEQEFASPFCMYECLAAYYDEKNAFAVSHSRIGRYEILYDFIVKTGKERSEQYMEMLTLDMYLRDNVKKRPEFLRESGVSSDEAAAFYKKEEKERTYLKAYEGYDRRQMRKMTHLERIDGKTVLFDYKNRDPLTGNAAIYYLSE